MMFYEDKLYVEMCEAEEIQKQSPSRKEYICILRGKFVSYTGDFYGPNMVWLPRLDQLIAMVSAQYETGIMDAHYRFYEWVEKGKWTLDSWSSPWLRYSESYEGMWLAFLMETKYNKTWNPDKKEWVETCGKR